MKCPNCQSDLNGFDFKGVRIDECESCGGKWFDRDELRKAKDRTDEDLNWLDFDLFDEKADEFETGPNGEKCPRDGSVMQDLTYKDSKVIIQKCEKCKGVFLDKKEFEKIINYLVDVMTSMPAKDYATESIKEFGEIFTGPESRISEIKDFLSIAKFFQVRLAVENPKLAEFAQNVYKYGPVK